MNFTICLLLSLLLSYAICGKNDKKKTKNSVTTMPKAFRMLTKILAAQSVIGLANGSSPPWQPPTNDAEQKAYYNPVDQIMSKPPSQSADIVSDYAPVVSNPPIHNNKNN